MRWQDFTPIPWPYQRGNLEQTEEWIKQGSLLLGIHMSITCLFYTHKSMWKWATRMPHAVCLLVTLCLKIDNILQYWCSRTWCTYQLILLLWLAGYSDRETMPEPVERQADINSSCHAIMALMADLDSSLMTPKYLHWPTHASCVRVPDTYNIIISPWGKSPAVQWPLQSTHLQLVALPWTNTVFLLAYIMKVYSSTPTATVGW